MRINEVSQELNINHFGNNNPKVLIVSGQHGNEKIPIKICQILTQLFSDYDVKGHVCIISNANPIAIANNNREAKGIDLNRSYGNEKNALTKIADQIKVEAAKCQLVIDCHSTPIKNLDQPLIINNNALDFNECWDCPSIQKESPPDSLRDWCEQQQIPIITLELVEGGDDSMNVVASKGILNCLKKLKVI